MSDFLIHLINILEMYNSMIILFYFTYFLIKFIKIFKPMIFTQKDYAKRNYGIHDYVRCYHTPCIHNGSGP